MSKFSWARGRESLAGFGGVPITLHVSKTGLPFYDALRLYGAIDLYVGVREDVSIRDCGGQWQVSARSRVSRINGRDLDAFSQVSGTKKKPTAAQLCARLRQSLISGIGVSKEDDSSIAAKGELDPVLQSGIRGTSASDYASMNSSSDPRCMALVPLSEALLAYAGACRTETTGEIQFLPIFEGRIDLGKVVSPLRAWLSVPNSLCAQALMLLSLKTALWADGYDKSFTALAYSKAGRGSLNYSGIIQIDSTAIGKIDGGEFCDRLFQVFRGMMIQSWKGGKAGPMASHTLATAQWLMQPLPGTLGPLIGAQEFLFSRGNLPFLIVPDNVREVFEMTYPQRTIDIDYDAVRRLAKAVSSAIYAMGKREKDPKKHWYNEVVALRNASHKEAFRHRVLTLIEQSRAENDWIGTFWNDEAFDPASLMESMGEDRPSFEKFRDCFRMYLIQESAPKKKIPDSAVDATGEVPADEETIEGDAQ